MKQLLGEIGQEDEDIKEDEEEPDVVCRMVRKTGTMIRRKQCTTRAQRKAMKKDADDFYQRMQLMPGGGVTTDP